MSSPTAADEAVIARARDAMTVLRHAEHTLLVAVGELAETAAWEASGHRRPARFLEELWRVDPAHAAHLVAHAEHLLALTALGGEALPPRLPRAAALAEAGVIGEEHLRVLVRAHDKIGRITGITPEQITQASELLAEAARSLAPAGLQRAVDRLLATLDEDGAAPEEEPEPIDELLVSHRRDGTLALTGKVHGVADVDLVLETLDALSGPAGPADPRTLGQRRAEAFLDLCAQARGPAGIADPAHDPEPPDPYDDDPVEPLDDSFPNFDWRDHRDEDSDASRRHGWLRPLPTPDPDPAPRPPHTGPASPKPGPGLGLGEEPPPEPPDIVAGADDTAPGDAPLDDAPPDDAPAATGRRGSVLPIPARAQIAVTIPLDWLRDQVGHAHLDSGRALDPATARRLACDANLIPVVLGARSEPVDLGRARYSVTETLRRLLLVRDRGCAHPGCTRRPNRTHAHHIRHWIDGGPTEPDNLVLLCRYHHLVHHGGWRITMINGRPWFTPPRWTDPHQRPIPGGPSLPVARDEAA